MMMILLQLKTDDDDHNNIKDDDDVILHVPFRILPALVFVIDRIYRLHRVLRG